MKKTAPLPVRVLRIALIALAALVLLAAAGAFSLERYVAGLPAVYGETFAAGLADKVDRLESVPGARVVVIGGSSVPFGLDSARAEAQTGMPWIDFGMYSTLGTRVMLDLARTRLHSGDIVIVAPELERKTLSLGTDGAAVWKALDGRTDLVKSLLPREAGVLLTSLPAFLSEKRALLAAGETLKPDGVYARASLNEYGDVAVERPYNVMALGCDPTNPVTPELSMYTEEFLAYLNDFVAEAARAGALVYYSFPPVDAAALTDGVTEETLAEFTAALASRLVCPIVTDIRDCLLDPAYFYDTNFHLNDVGARYNTDRLVRDVLRAEGRAPETALVLPPPPDRPDFFIDASLCDTTGWFLFERADEAYALVGLTDEGKAQKSLTVPYGWEGRRVTVIKSGAFSGAAAEEIVFPADTCVALAEDGAFSGAASLRRVRMLCLPDQVLVGENLLRDASAELRFLIPRALYGGYAAHYFWSPYYRSMIASDE